MAITMDDSNPRFSKDFNPEIIGRNWIQQNSMNLQFKSGIDIRIGSTLQHRRRSKDAWFNVTDLTSSKLRSCVTGSSVVSLSSIAILSQILDHFLAFSGVFVSFVAVLTFASFSCENGYSMIRIWNRWDLAKRFESAFDCLTKIRDLELKNIYNVLIHNHWSFIIDIYNLKMLIVKCNCTKTNIFNHSKWILLSIKFIHESHLT